MSASARKCSDDAHKLCGPLGPYRERPERNGPPLSGGGRAWRGSALSSNSGSPYIAHLGSPAPELRGTNASRGSWPPDRRDVMPGMEAARLHCGQDRVRSGFGNTTAGRFADQGRARLAPPLHRGDVTRSARVAERQTQWTQNPPGATPCEFESRLGHLQSLHHLGALTSARPQSTSHRDL